MKGILAPLKSEKVKVWHFIALNVGITAMLTGLFTARYFSSWEGFVKVAPTIAITFFISCALSYGGYLTDWFLEPRISWVKAPARRLLATISFYSAYSFIASYTIIALYVWLIRENAFSDIPWMTLLEEVKMPMITALIIMTIFTAHSWLREWRKAAIEAEQLKTQKMASQYQSLKNQLNPHFLFNSLNALTNLVYEDVGKSAKFIEQLSQIYRYVLDAQLEQLVSLEQEIQFAHNYLSLQKIRFGDNLSYQIDVSTGADFYLPPLSLQIVLENALKHNIVSKERPLKIQIAQQGEVLWVSNNLQLKINPDEKSAGIGWENIRKQYALLSNKTPRVIESDKEYKVELPLLMLG